MAASPPRDPLVIRDLEFLGGMATANGWRPHAELPEIAFAGRSNVGKSSLLNTLVRRKAFARVSRTPGRTREINFFRVNDQFVLVDLPGYGYARISRAQRAGWAPLIEHYLRTSERLHGVVQLLDVRHDPSTEDRQMLDFLGDLGVPVVIAVTKIDKLSATRAASRVAELGRDLDLPDDQLIPFSGVTGAGRDELAAAIVALVERPSWRAATDQSRMNADGRR
jgi:GTP-binding protein